MPLPLRRSLRPLKEVERTAAAIAGGDLHRRVPERDPRTEVGGLSVALNGMLGQIQEAFAATAASEESARRSEEKMRRFVADAGHELRTPLTTIRGFAELYRQGASSDTALLMDRIESESRRMGLLVEDLLVLARLDAQRPLEQNPVDLLALAADAVHDARAVAPERTVELEVFDGPGIPEVLGDDARLRQVLGNLVTNALTHTPADARVTVRIGTAGPDAVLGGVGSGWAVIRTALAHERVGIARYARCERLLSELARSLSEGTGDDGEPLPASLRTRWARALVQVRVARLLAYRTVAAQERGEVPDVAASLARIAVTLCDQSVAEVLFAALDERSLEAGPDAPLHGAVEDHWRYAQAATVASGTIEVQRMIVAKSLLAGTSV